MSLIRDTDHILEAVRAINVGHFVSEYCRSKYKIKSLSRKDQEKLMERMEKIFMELVGDRDATRDVIGMSIRREFKQCELRYICDNKVGNLIRLMMRRNPGKYK